MAQRFAKAGFLVSSRGTARVWLTALFEADQDPRAEFLASLRREYGSTSGLTASDIFVREA